MSVELPEAKILAEQMNQELKGKQVQSNLLKDVERLQRIGMVDKDNTSFNKLIGAKIEEITSRGNVLRVRFDNGTNLILGPEYGGEIFYHTDEEDIPKFHLRLDFSDGTLLTVRLTSMGVIQVLRDSELERSYVYKRDFDPKKLSPNEGDFTVEYFSEILSDLNKMLKAVLVGKDAVIVGISNNTFQDILYRARIHPKQKASELNVDEKQKLYAAIRSVLKERIELRGKKEFHDLFGNEGSYVAAMGPHMKQQNCSECGTPIQKLSVGGGHVYLCLNCQI